MRYIILLNGQMLLNIVATGIRTIVCEFVKHVPLSFRAFQRAKLVVNENRNYIKLFEESLEKRWYPARIRFSRFLFEEKGIFREKNSLFYSFEI